MMQRNVEMYRVSESEKNYLRELAKKQLEYARLPVMDARKQTWVNLNTGKHAVPPVVIETVTFEQDFMPAKLLKCSGQFARKVEYQLLKNLREYEILNDDKVVPDFYEIPYQVDIDRFGVLIEEEHAMDSSGRNIGYVYHTPIQNLEEDFSKLRKPKIKVDWETTKQESQAVEEILGDIMPIRYRGEPPMIALTWDVIRLFGMENFMIAMYEEPELIHKLMNYLMENQIAVMEFYEKQEILTLNTGNQHPGVSSYGFLDMESDINKGKCRLKDIWLWAEAEETSAISPEMFREFCLPYIARAAEKVGRIYYGCCEPLHNHWKMIEKAIPNIKKVSVSPWSDQEKLGDMLRGTNIVFSRKPLANYLGVGVDFDEEGWRTHIKDTLKAARGCQCEIIMRDIYQVPNLETAARAIAIAREEANRYFG